MSPGRSTVAPAAAAPADSLSQIDAVLALSSAADGGGGVSAAVVCSGRCEW